MWQARAAWRWWNFYESKASPDKALVRINIDETSLCVHQGSVQGAIFKRIATTCRVEQQVDSSKRRRNVTFACSICDDARIQAILPQFIVGNEITFKAKELHSLRAASGSNFVVLRQKSAWINERLFVAMVRQIAVSLAPFMASVQPVLFFDCARLHVTGMLRIAAVFCDPIRLLRCCSPRVSKGGLLGVDHTATNDVAAATTGHTWLPFFQNCARSRLSAPPRIEI